MSHSLNITLRRGDLFQLAAHAKRLTPAKASHAERLRRITDQIAALDRAIGTEHNNEVRSQVDLLPEEQKKPGTQRIAMMLASTMLTIAVDSKDLQALVAAMVSVWGMTTETGAGMPVEVLRELQATLVALGVWDAWGLGAKLVMDDPELDELFPLGSIIPAQEPTTETPETPETPTAI